MHREKRRSQASIQYREFGNGSENVLLVHGWMVSGRVWDPLLPFLADYRLIVPDLRGTGASPADGRAVALEDHLTDLADLCTALDVQATHLVGHSMGGQLAALLAAREPARFVSLTLMNPVPVDGLPLPEDVQPLFRECGGKRDRLGSIVDMSCLRLPRELRERMVDDAEKIDAATIRTGFDAWRRGLPGTSLERVRMPTTVIATDDPFLPPAFLEQTVIARLPNARLAHLAGAGHYPQCEMPGETSDLLRSLWS